MMVHSVDIDDPHIIFPAEVSIIIQDDKKMEDLRRIFKAGYYPRESLLDPSFKMRDGRIKHMPHMFGNAVNLYHLVKIQYGITDDKEIRAFMESRLRAAAKSHSYKYLNGQHIEKMVYAYAFRSKKGKMVFYRLKRTPEAFAMVFEILQKYHYDLLKDFLRTDYFREMLPGVFQDETWAAQSLDVRKKLMDIEFTIGVMRGEQWVKERMREAMLRMEKNFIGRTLDIDKCDLERLRRS